ncbi:MAG: lipid biosynthesis B12-binding/radical SAM protein [SAR324 cluster bacterium]|nr:lipid biosynthesis B12-binding/radical SAM protein [SAR324 cluster bacterium]
MKVLLVSANREKSPYPVVPIGVLCISKALVDAGHDVKLLDLCFVKNDRQAIEECLAEYAADYIGISIRNIDNTNKQNKKNYTPRTKKIVTILKENSNVPVIVGGSGYSVFPEQLIKELGADYGIAGPGEAPIIALLQALEQKTPLADVPSLRYFESGELKINENPKTHAFYEPWLEGLDLSTYVEQGSLMGIQTKRGCAFKCSYCTYPKINGSRFTLLETEKVVDQLTHYQKNKGFNDFFFVDDVFNSPYEHAAQLCRDIIKQKLNIRWYAFCSPNGFDENLAKLLVEAGCKGVEFGTDAGHAATLNGHGKDFSPDDILKAGLACKAVNLAQCHYLIFGGPGETDETAEATIQLMHKINPTMVLSFIGTRIYSDTKLAEIALEDGQVTADQDFLLPVYYQSKHFDAEKLQSRLDELDKSSVHWMTIDGSEFFKWDSLKPYVEMGYRGPFWDLIHRPTRMSFTKKK